MMDILQDKVVAAAIKIKTQVDESFKLMRKTPKNRDYPACVCSATSDLIAPTIVSEYSRRMKKDSASTHLVSEFRTKLCGEVGEISPVTNCPFPIGNCAEAHAADAILHIRDHNTDDILFSVCLRPRTLEIIDSCVNCTTLFPQLLK